MRSSYPLVSVIVPSYNYEQILGECIKAIQNQYYSNIEIIIVDDHSTDNSFAIAKTYPVRLFQTDKNAGVAAARNLGVSVSNGSILFFVDADVVLEADAIASAVSILTSQDNIVSVCGIYEAYPLIRHSIWEEFRSLQAYVWRIASIGEVSAGFFSLGAIKRDVFGKVGVFNTSLQQTEEIDYGERLSRQGKIILSDLVRGQHDDDYLLIPMLKKFWRRSRDRVPFYFQKRSGMKGFETKSRLVGTGLSGVLLICLSLSILFPPMMLIFLGTYLAMIWIERDIYVESFKKLGFAKTLGFSIWYLLFHIAAGLGVISELVKYCYSPKFRKMYGDWGQYA